MPKNPHPNGNPRDLLPPVELQPETALNPILADMDTDALLELALESDKRLKAHNIDYHTNVAMPSMNMEAQIIAMMTFMVEKEMITQEELNHRIALFKATHMKHIEETVLPQIRSAMARAAIMQPGGMPGGGLHIPGQGG